MANIKEFFDNLEYAVKTAPNGQQGLLRAKEHQPTSGLSRYFDATYGRPRDPASDTWNRRSYSGLEVSGYASAPLAREPLQQGAYDFFQKPIDLLQLHEAIKRIRTMQDLSWSLFFTWIYMNSIHSFNCAWLSRFSSLSFSNDWIAVSVYSRASFLLVLVSVPSLYNR